MEIWVDHYYADHLKEGVMLYAPYIKTVHLNDETLEQELDKISDIADLLVGLQFLFEDAYRSRICKECPLDLPDQIERLAKLLLLTTNNSRQLFIPSKHNKNIPSLGQISWLMENADSVDYDVNYDYDDQYGFIDLYGAREDRCGKDYKKYERMAQKLAGSNLAKLNSGIESMVDDAIKLSNQPWK
ncbi:hypothetical protein LMB24_03555 [Limosilactobacillus reuteri]|uniref:hypothetical protein n=1 Tax=Limosilactobacillus reuteri TaxID=1598 RepID=UPI001E41DC4E|nr:hypothetical protein [Limosilactobacillus reuteri]MCC4351165.1 hypothetical protein [Limosilactobacillus reuteri]MCC4360408.1 hypothetical protein [Limosilactobacillus reuteri]MCC4378828.1 hypothetical protein [Limosilactobacillus reuteri]MCC4407949.1 hypothetical protein [Limosilactobacillus reuteri]MCC4415520.1 hypothetical protein [Limosilactobacillus reuteri]